MKILALDTSGMVATVAIANECNTVAEFTLNYKKTHSQTIMPMIKNISDMVELDLNLLDYIAVSSGPGSFTGLRIGAATAKGLAHCLSIPIVSVPTLDGLAYNIFESDKIICPIMDARRNQVYSAFYRWNDNSIQMLSDYMVESIDIILDIAMKFDSKVIFLGDGVAVHYDRIKTEMGKNCIFAPSNCNMQRASSIASIAFEFIKEGKYLNCAEFAPTYIRKSQAEREYNERIKENTDARNSSDEI